MGSGRVPDAVVSWVKILVYMVCVCLFVSFYNDAVFSLRRERIEV